MDAVRCCIRVPGAACGELHVLLEPMHGYLYRNLPGPLSFSCLNVLPSLDETSKDGLPLQSWHDTGPDQYNALLPHPALAKDLNHVHPLLKHALIDMLHLPPAWPGNIGINGILLHGMH